MCVVCVCRVWYDLYELMLSNHHPVAIPISKMMTCTFRSMTENQQCSGSHPLVIITKTPISHRVFLATEPISFPAHLLYRCVVCARPSVCIHACFCMCTCVYVCVCVHMCVSWCMCIYVCILVYVCICVHMFMQTPCDNRFTPCKGYMA